MSTRIIKLDVVNGKSVAKAVEWQPGVAGTQTVQAVQNGRFVLIDESTGLAPQHVSVSRVGKDLHIGLEGASADQPQLVIQDYYGSGSQLAGEAQGGQYFEYTTASGAGGAGTAGDLGAIAEGVSTPVGLGAGSAVPGLAEAMAAAQGAAGAMGLGTLGAIGAAFAVPLGAMAAGVASSAASNDHASSRDKQTPPEAGAPAAPGLTGVFDDNGDTLKPITDGAATGDTTPLFKGTGETPGNAIEVWFEGARLGATTVGQDGAWQMSLDAPLPDGAYQFSIVEVDTQGRRSDSTDYHMTVDTSPPSRPLVDRVLDHVDPHTGVVNRLDVTNDNRPIVEGRGKIGSVIHLYDSDGTTPLGSVRIDESGVWSIRVSGTLADGRHGFIAVATDDLGNTSAASRPYIVDIDTTPPVQPTIDELIDHVGTITGPIASHGATDDPKPTLSGTAEAGTRVTIRDGDTVIGRVTAGQDGTWRFTPATALSDGEHVLTVRAEDPAGNVSVPSEAFHVNVDTVPPAKPLVTEVVDNEGPVTGALQPHDTTDDPRPEIKGTAEHDSLVLIYDTVFGKQVLLGSVTAGKDGSWAFRPESALPEGDHQLVIVARDAVGNRSEPSEAFDFTLEIGGVPASPSITGVFDAVEPQIGNVERYGATNDTQPTVNGVAPAGSIVNIYLDGRVYASTTANEHGRWNFRPDTPLTEGQHLFSASAQMPGGKPGMKSGEYPINVDTQAPGASSNETLNDNVGDATGPIANGATTDDATPAFGGTAEPHAHVTIYDGNTVLGTARVGDDGHWSFHPGTPLADGAHHLFTTVTDAAGNVSPRGAVHDFVVDTSRLVVAINEVIDHVGTVQGVLPPGGITDDRHPEVTGKAVPGSLVTLYVDGAPAGSVQADDTGHWALKVATELAEGPHAITATATLDGKESAATAPFAIEVDLTPPDQPSIDQVRDDVGPSQSLIPHHGTTDDTTPTLSGMAEPGSVLTLYDNGRVIGSTVVDATYNWSFTPQVPLVDGPHSFTAVARDAAGNASEPSEAFDVIVDTTGPGSVLITDAVDATEPQTGSVPNGGATNDTHPALHGTAKAGAIVTILDNGRQIGTATADAQGKWVFTPAAAQALADGNHKLTAWSRDANGARSEVSPPYELVVDTVAPDAPSITEIVDNVGELTGPLHPKDVTDDARPVLNGTAEQGSIVLIHDVVNGTRVLLGSTRADASGHWSFRPDTPLPEGTHAISAVATDAAGNASKDSAAFDFSLQVGGVPGEPAITGVFDAVQPQVGNVAPDGATNDTRPTVSGTAPAGSIVHVFVDGRDVGSVAAGENGRWTFRPAGALADGPHTFQAAVATPGGTLGEKTGEYAIHVDTEAPAAATNETLVDNAGAITGAIGNGSTTDDATPTYSGKAEPNALVKIHDGDTVIGSTVAGQDGNWSYRLEKPLAEGAHRLSTTVTDAAGNESARGVSHDFVVDTSHLAIAIGQVVDHVGTVQGELQPGESTDDRHPEVNGKATPGSLVTVYVDGTAVGSVQAGSDGSWTLKVGPELAEGRHAITATATVDGKESAATAAFEIVVDVTPPAQPSIEQVFDDVGTEKGPVANHGTTDDSTPTLSGKAEAGSLVTILDGSTVLGSTVAGSDGSWRFTPGSALQDGTHAFTVTARDAAGNLSQPSEPFEVTVDTSNPGTTVITEVIDAVEPQTGPVEHGGASNDPRPTLNGTAKAGSIVTIRDGDTVLGSVKVDGEGKWSIRIDAAHALKDGHHTLVAQSRDASGLESKPSQPFGFDVDTVAPAKPSITEIVDNVGELTGPLHPKDTTDDARPVMSGAAEKGSIVLVYDLVNGGKTLLGSARADADGHWTFRPDTPLANGAHDLSIVAKDAAGNESPSSDGFAFSVMAGVPSAPAITGVADAVEPQVGNVAPHGATNDAQPTVHGTARPGSIVHVYVDGKEAGTTTADQDGNWSYKPAAALSDAGHVFQAQAESADGKLSAKTGEYAIVVDTQAPEASTGETLIDAAGDATGPIENGSTTDDATPTYSGKAEPNAIVKIHDGDTVIGSTVVGKDGSWSFHLTTQLADGEHHLSTTVTDAAGNESPRGASHDFTVDTSHLAIAIDQVVDHAGSITGPLQPGQPTDDPHPEVLGKAAAGSLVTVYVDGTAVGSVQAGSDGKWALTLEPALAEGKHAITATATVDGKESAATAAFEIVVDVTPPAQPSIDQVYDDVGTIQGSVKLHGVTDDTTPTLSGKAEAGAVVTILDGTTVLGSVTADEAGTWRFTPSAALADGAHSFTATARDAAGNLSQPGAAFDVTIVTTPPATPAIVEVIDNVGSLTGPLHPKDVTDDAQPVLKGTAEKLGVVLVYDAVNGTKLLLGSVQADADGHWTFRPGQPLTEGTHALSVVGRDAAGNESAPSEHFDFTLLVGGVPDQPAITGVLDAVEPQTGNVAPHGATNDTRPTVNGTAPKGTTIHVLVDGKDVGTAVSDENGRWAFRLPTALSDGDHAITAAPELAGGKLGGETGAYDIVVDTQAPEASTGETLIDAAGETTGPIGNGSTTDDTTPTYSGKAEPNAIVKIHDGDTVIGSTVAGKDGSWSFHLTTPLAEGEHHLSTTVTDAAGNESPRGASHDFTVDTSHLAIAIDQLVDHAGSITGPLQPGQPTDDQHPEVLGKATPDSLVTVYVDGKAAGSVQAGSDGKWTLTLEPALAEGRHAITATSTVNGAESKATEAFDIVVDVTPPAQPSIKQVYDDVGADQGPVKLHGTTDDTTPTLSGKAEAGAVVTILDGTTVLGSVTADEAGTWRFTPSLPMADGKHVLSVVASDAAGNASQPSEAFDFTIDTAGPGRPVISTVIDAVDPQTGLVTNDGYTNDTRPTLNGTAKAGMIVTIFDGSTVLGSTTADKTGNWSFRPDGEHVLAEGAHALHATAKEAGGTEGPASEAYTIHVDTTAPEAPTISDVIDNFGDVTGSVGQGEATDDPRPTLKGTGEPNTFVTIYDRVNGSNTFLGTTTVDADGNWVLRPANALKNGSHEFVATGSDRAGNESGASTAYDITLLQGVPTAPAISGVIDAVEPLVGNIEPNGWTNDPQPTVNGTALPGQTVHVAIDGREAGTVIASATGQWSYRPTVALGDGAHTFSVRAEGSDGQMSAPTGLYPIQVDTQAPSVSTNETLIDAVGAITGAIVNGTTTDDSTPTYSGRAEANAVVTVYDGSTVLGSTRVAADGSWHFRPATPLADGAHHLSTTVTDRAGNVSGHGQPIDFTVDASHVQISIEQVIDQAGSITGPLHSGQPTDDTQPEVKGRATAGSLVRIYVDGHAVASVQAGSDGKWALKLPQPLADGAHAITASSTQNGVESARTAAFDVTVDTQAPDRPSIDVVMDDVGVVQGAVANDGWTDDATPTLKGHAEAGSLVRILDGDKVIGSTHADARGAWAFTPAQPLADGTHAFTVTARDEAGNTSEPAKAFTIHVDTSGPHAPAIVEVIDNAGEVTGALHPRDTTDDVRPVVNGTAEKHGVVLIYDTVFGQKVLVGSTQADADGKWSFQPLPPAAPLVDGAHHLVAVTQDAGGNQSGPSNAFDFTVLVGGVPTAPAITGVYDAVEAQIGNVALHGVTNDPRATVMGTAPAGQVVHVYLDQAEIGTVKADATGHWWFRPDTPMQDGAHGFTVKVEDASGKPGLETGAYTFTVDTQAPDAATGQTLVGDVGAVTGAIAEGGVTSDATPLYAGKAEPGAIVTVYDNGRAIGSTVVDAKGNWHFQPTEPLADGHHSLSTRVTDPAGNTGPASESSNFTVDTQHPGVTIAIDQVVDHAGAITGPLQPGQSTDDVRPEIVGHALASALVKVYVNGTLAGSVQAQADGAWSLKLATALAQGDYAVTATSTPEGGKESDPSAAFGFSVDIEAPAKPSIDQILDDVGIQQGVIANGGFSDDTTPTLSGKAEANAIVIVRDGDATLGSAVADATGKWSFTPFVRLSDGEHVFTVVAQDAAGNTSAASDGYTLNLNTVAPGSPAIEHLFDEVGPITGDVVQNGVTDDTIPTFGGKAEADALVTLYADGNGEHRVLGSTYADANGEWSIKPHQDFDDGVFRISMTAIDKAGNVSAPSEPYLLEVDTTPPATPMVTDMIENVEGVTGSIGADGGTTTDHRPTVVGTSEAGTLITVRLEGSGVIGSTVADEHGHWSFRPAEPFGDGVHALSFSASDRAGNPSATTEKFSVTIEPVPVETKVAHDAGGEADSLFAGEHDLATHAGDAGSGTMHPHGDVAATPPAPAAVEQQDGHAVPAVQGADQSFDLTAFAAAASQARFDVIDLGAAKGGGAGGNTLSLTIDDVLAHGGKDLFVDDGRTQLMVKGDAHDSVDLSGSLGGQGGDAWAKSGETNVDGVTYAVYDNAAHHAELLVQQGVTTHLM